MFVVLVKLHLNDTYIGLIIVHASFTIPFATWVLTDFYRSIPVDLEAAGYVDGASLARVLWHIVLPLSIPGCSPPAPTRSSSPGTTSSSRS